MVWVVAVRNPGNHIWVVNFLDGRLSDRSLPAFEGLAHHFRAVERVPSSWLAFRRRFLDILTDSGLTVGAVDDPPSDDSHPHLNVAQVMVSHSQWIVRQHRQIGPLARRDRAFAIFVEAGVDACRATMERIAPTGLNHIPCTGIYPSSVARFRARALIFISC